MENNIDRTLKVVDEILVQLQDQDALDYLDELQNNLRARVMKLQEGL